MHMDCRSVCIVLWLATQLVLCAGVLHEGDFIHTARRTQFLQVRTHWHDLTEHHCPRFGIDRLVALPLNKPQSMGGEIKDYRLQLSFDGDRVLTPWLTVMSRAVTSMPLLEVQLRTAGDELRGVRAKVVTLPDDYLVHHEALWNEFRNASHWPKHVLISYTFDRESEIDFDTGLYVLLGTGLIMALLLALNALAGVQSKLAQFFREVVPLMGDEAAMGASSSGGALPGAVYVPLKGGTHVE